MLRQAWQPARMIHSRLRGFAIFAFAPLVLAATVTGCDDKPKVDPTADSASAPAAPDAATTAMIADAAPEAAAAEAPKRGGIRGAGGTLFAAARAQTFPADLVKKIDDAEAIGSGPPDPGMRDALKDMHGEIVSEIKAGKIENAKLEPKYVAIEKFSQAEHDKDGDALNALHAALDPAQRKTVADAARAQLAKRDEHMGKAADAGPPPGADAGAKPSMMKRNMDRLVRGIDLDADQQKKVDAATPKDDPKAFDPAEMKKKSEALYAAFEKDPFDAKKIDAFDQKKTRAGLEGETKLLALLVPILKPEQREKLAAKMEKGQSPHGMRRPGFGPQVGHGRPEVMEQDDDFN